MPASSAPLVSVVIATYNRPAYLRNAIASVVNGEYRNVEIVAADDLGSDLNREVATGFADRRIVYHRNETNLGMAANHIHAFRDLVSGEFIAILNDDDEWEPAFLSKLMPHVLDNRDVVLAFSDHYVIDERGRIDLVMTEGNTRRWRRRSLPRASSPLLALSCGNEHPGCTGERYPARRDRLARFPGRDWQRL